MASVIEPGFAEACPICTTPAAAVLREHVPPQYLGGRKMINTCDPCNNGLGARTEGALCEWFDQRSRFRLTPNIVAGDTDAFAEHMQPGVTGTFSIVEPRRAQYMTGLLKQSFLAAVLFLRGVPNCPSTSEIQRELLRARDAPSPRHVVLGDHAAATNAFRTGLPRNGLALALMRGELGGETYPLISLAGTLLASWPFPKIDPFTW